MTQDQRLVISSNFYDALIKRVLSHMQGRKAALVTDARVMELHGKTLLNALGPLPVHIMEEGEKSKTRSSKQALEDFLFDCHFTKSDLLIAAGGGALLDAAGFTASCYKRGLPYLTLPTTLLAMVDSCLGGKTAINTRYGKNTLGAIYFPLETISYLPFLKTLEAKAIHEGLAEAVKYSFIHPNNILDRCKAFVKTGNAEPLVEACQRVKIEMVEGDLLDGGKRQLLNFGHTVAHAIEHVHRDEKISHGQAVMLGMLVEAYISKHRFKSARLLVNEIQSALKALNMHVPKLSFKEIHLYIEAMLSDKKNKKAGSIHMVLLKNRATPFIDEGRYSHHIDIKSVEKALLWMQTIYYQKEESGYGLRH